MQKKGRRRDQNIALAAPLIPFVKKQGPDEVIDVDDGLYNFLSPKLPIPSIPSASSFSNYSVSSTEGVGTPTSTFGGSSDSFASGTDQIELMHSRCYGSKSDLTVAASSSVGVLPDAQSKITEKPEWFQKGQVCIHPVTNLSFQYDLLFRLTFYTAMI